MTFKKVVLDTSILVAYFNPNDIQANKAVCLIKKFKREKRKIVLHPLIAIETLSVLKLKVEKRALIFCQEILFNPEIFEMKEIDLNLSVDAFYFSLFNKVKNLSLIDSIIIEYCLTNNFELFTFDKAMEREYQRLINKFTSKKTV